MEGLEPDAILCYSKSLFLVNFTVPTFSRKKAKHIKIFFVLHPCLRKVVRARKEELRGWSVWLMKGI